MQTTLLRIENLHASVEEIEILKGLHLEIKEGEIHVLMGPNGAEKSALANVIMGHLLPYLKRELEVAAEMHIYKQL